MRQIIVSRLVGWREDAIQCVFEQEITVVKGGRLSPSICQWIVSLAHEMITDREMDRVTIEFP